MSKIYSELVTAFIDFVGVYYIIQQIWEASEEAEFGKYIVSKADTVACFVISLVIVILLLIWREISNA